MQSPKGRGPLQTAVPFLLFPTDLKAYKSLAFLVNLPGSKHLSEDHLEHGARRALFNHLVSGLHTPGPASFPTVPTQARGQLATHYHRPQREQQHCCLRPAPVRPLCQQRRQAGTTEVWTPPSLRSLRDPASRSIRKLRRQTDRAVEGRLPCTQHQLLVRLGQ